MSSRAYAVPFVALLLWAAAPLQAQTGPCSFEDCALRVQYDAFGSEIVRAGTGEAVIKLGFWAPELTEALARSDSALAHARAFRSQNNSGKLLLVGSGIALAAGVLLRANDSVSTGWMLAPTAVGAALSVGATIRLNQAKESLSQAIWWHNRSLSR